MAVRFSLEIDALHNMKLDNPHDKLDTYYKQVQGIILDRQDWITGLLPASTAVTVHGNYTDAWVRDNVYSILAAWGWRWLIGASKKNRDELMFWSKVSLS